MNDELVNHINAIFQLTQSNQDEFDDGIGPKLPSIILSRAVIASAKQDLNIKSALEELKSIPNEDVEPSEESNDKPDSDNLNDKQKLYLLLYPFRDQVLTSKAVISKNIGHLKSAGNVLPELLKHYYALKQHNLFKIIELNLNTIKTDNIASWNTLLSQILKIAKQSDSLYDDDDLHTFMELFSVKEGKGLPLRMKTRDLKINCIGKASDISMDGAYLACNAFSVFLVIGSLVSGNFGAAVGILGAMMGIGWNVYDGLGAFNVALDCYNRGDRVLATTNLVSGTQLLGFTSAGIAINGVGLTTSVISAAVASTIAGAFLGFSFAACMLVGVINERISANRCKASIAKIDNQLANVDISDGQRNILEKTRLMKKAQLADHKNNKKAWWLCTIAMTSVAIAGVATATVLTGGIAAIAVPVAMTLFATATAIARNYYFHWKTSNVDKLKKAQDKGVVDKLITLKNLTSAQDVWGDEKKDDIINKLEKLMLEDPDKANEIIDKVKGGFFLKLVGLKKNKNQSQPNNESDSCEQEKTLITSQLLTTAVRKPGLCFWKKTTLSDYLSDLLFKDPDKAQKVLDSLTKEGNNAEFISHDEQISAESMKNALAEHRGGKFTSWGKTTGLTLFDRVKKAVSNSSRTAVHAVKSN